MGGGTIDRQDVVGLIPAAGMAARISPLPCSKEIYPIGFKKNDPQASKRPKAICEYLLEPMRKSGVRNACICLRRGKWDILSYLGSGSAINMHLAYLIAELPYGVPYTVDAAFPFIQGKRVAFGFPDTIFHPEDAFVHLMEKQFSSNADIVLGLFPASNPQKVDMVRLGDDGKVRELQIKPRSTQLNLTWILAVWNETFTEFLHRFVRQHHEGMPDSSTSAFPGGRPELHLGEVIQASIAAKLNVDHVVFQKGSFIDIGTIEDMAKATHQFSSL